MKDQANQVEEKIARICWNERMWEYPTGEKGKSREKTSFERVAGFGHEEWNFATERVIDNYLYGYLEQFNNKAPIHSHKIYNISLYTIETINSQNNSKKWLGKIDSVEVISGQESVRIYNIYKENGWLFKMEANLLTLGLPLEPFQATDSRRFFNIRFRLENIHLLDVPTEIEKSDKAIPSYYYNLLNKIKEPELSKEAGDFIFRAGHRPRKRASTDTSNYMIHGKSLFHNKLQTKIFKLLVNSYESENVGTEIALEYQAIIDVVVRTTPGYIFYEIKTSPTAKTAIREAFGQLMEYAYWSGQVDIAKLVIVAPPKATEAAINYMARLRQDFKIPIFYQQYDVKENVLCDEV